MTYRAQTTSRRRTAPGIHKACHALLVCVGLLCGHPALAQIPGAAPPEAPAAAPQEPEDALGRSTPWGTVNGFIRAAGRGDFVKAAEYLNIGRSRVDAPELAEQLFVVLDRGLTADIDRLSRSTDGNLQDGLPAPRDRVGIVENEAGPIDVQVERVERAGQPAIWMFAGDTLEAVPAAFAGFAELPVERYIPRPLREIRLLEFPLYRWILAPVFLGLAWLLGSLLTRAFIPLVRPPLRRLTGEHDDRTTALVGAPIRLMLVGVALRLFSGVSVSLQARQFWIRVAATVWVLGGAWLAIRFADVVAELGTRRVVRTGRLGRVAVLGLARGLFRALVVVVAALSLLYRAGFDLTAILTGIGIGGIGVALAAQKTLENFFGGVMIISDEPMRVGDFCRVGDLLGTIEAIGLRSTRIRTLSRTVVAVPNGQLATMNIENFARRDKFWLRHAIGIRYESSPDQIRHLLATVRAMLHEHPRVERDGARIRMVGFGASSIDLEIFAYVYAAEYAEFLAVQEDILLRVMDLIAESGTSVAFPSQTTYIARDTPLDPEKTQAAERRVREWRDRGDLPFPDARTDQGDILGDPVRYPPPGSAMERHGKAP